MRLHHRRVAAGALLAVFGVLAFVALYFEPQKLVIDDHVAERPPVSVVRTLSSAPFRSYEHATTGRARVIATAAGRRYVRFENFATSNGPALKVYLSTAPATGPAGAFDDRFVDLGDLKGNIGAQNYAIPRDLALAGYRSVVVWCKRFGVAFGAASL